MASGVFTLKQQQRALVQGAWTNQKPVAVNYLVVAGGGAGGGCRSTSEGPGGGGAGGLLQGNIAVATGTAITVTVGAGGSSATASALPTSGNNSVFGSVTATGGGKGGTSYIDASLKNDQPASGGSGGGGFGSAGSIASLGAQGTSGQGNAGGPAMVTSPYPGGGGGGAGTRGREGISASSLAGSGGAGIASDISGTRTVYAGGGGGGGTNSNTLGLGGVGGGGNGGAQSNNGVAGTANTGGGGGAMGRDGTSSGAGGSGIVIVSYPDNYAAAASTTGSPTIGTSGSGSISFNGSSQYLNYAAQSGFALGSGNFTIELFLYLNSLGSGDVVVFDARPQGTQGVYPTIYFNSSTIYWFVNSSARITGSGALAINTWYHIAVSRVGTDTKMFINGSQVGSTYTSDSNNYLVGSDRPAIATGGYSFGSNLMNGYISNLRIVKGTGVYSSNFTAPAVPLTAITNTTFLLSTASGAYLADSGGNNYVATPAGSPTWNSQSPFATGLGYKNRVYTWTSSGSITF